MEQYYTPAHPINQRPASEVPARRRTTLLLGYPEERLEAVVLQWENANPSVLIQLQSDTREPVRFEGEPPVAQSAALETDLQDFIDPIQGRIFGKRAHAADLLFSQRAFSLLQPEPDLVLPPAALWECRAEALRATHVADQPGIVLINGSASGHS
jgi:hypothetical protein